MAKKTSAKKRAKQMSSESAAKIVDNAKKLKKKTAARTLEARTTETKNEVSSTEVEGYDTDEATGDIIKIPADAQTGNPHNVPADQWARWNGVQQIRFNELYSKMLVSPSLFNSHAEARMIDTEQWRTIAWNVAWCAADCA